MKKSIFEIIKDIQKDLNYTNISTQNSENSGIPQETLEKYKNFKKWLDDNGAFYQKLSFAVKFSNIIGCKALEGIKKIYLYFIF